MSVVRYDIDGELREPVKTDEGFLRLDAFVTRAGVFTYSDASGNVTREWRPPEEVSQAASLDTLKSKPITVDHPMRADGRPLLLDPGTVKEHSVGTIADDVRFDSLSSRVRATMTVQDKRGIDAINGGQRQVSATYRADIEKRSGTTPQGECFDAIQRNIRYNGAAIVMRGRAGASVHLRADSGDALMINDSPPPPQKGKTTMARVTIDGMGYDVEDANFARSIVEQGKSLDDTTARADSLKEELDGAQKETAEAIARADAAQENIESLKGEKTALEAERDVLKADAEKAAERADSEDVFLARFQERTKLLEAAKRFDIADSETMEAPAIKRACVAKDMGDALRVDADDAYITAAFDVVMARAPEANTALKAQANQIVNPDARADGAPTRSATVSVSDLRNRQFASLNQAEVN